MISAFALMEMGTMCAHGHIQYVPCVCKCQKAAVLMHESEIQPYVRHH